MSVVRVESEDMYLSAARTDLHAEDLHLRHGAADGRIEAARFGVPIGAAAALSAAVFKSQADTTALFGNLVDHGEKFRPCTRTLDGADERNAGLLDAVDPHAVTLDIRL